MYFTIRTTLRALSADGRLTPIEMDDVTVSGDYPDDPTEEIVVESFKFPELGMTVEEGPLFDAAMKMISWRHIEDEIVWLLEAA